ncbi:MAG: hypothetical protein ACI8ZM_002780 [Crocinitomix sp.]|jgi:hypothetical protein
MAERIILVDDDSPFELNLEVGYIYRFSSAKINSPQEHRFILCLHEDDGDAYFVCCTSQEATVNRLIRRNKYCESTFPYFSPDDENQFTKDTWVNCNEIQVHSTYELEEKLDANNFSRQGKISLDHFEQIKTAMINSETIEDIIPISMRHPDA